MCFYIFSSRKICFFLSLILSVDSIRIHSRFFYLKGFFINGQNRNVMGSIDDSIWPTKSHHDYHEPMGCFLIVTARVQLLVGKIRKLLYCKKLLQFVNLRFIKKFVFPGRWFCHLIWQCLKILIILFHIQD